MYSDNSSKGIFELNGSTLSTPVGFLLQSACISLIDLLKGVQLSTEVRARNGILGLNKKWFQQRPQISADNTYRSL